MDNNLRLANPQSEAVVLSALMSASMSLEMVSEILTAEDFADGRNRLIYHAMIVLDSRHDAIDPVALANYLGRCCRSENEFGGIPYLGALIANVIPTNALAHARAVRDVAYLRRLVQAMRKAEAGLSNDLPPAQQAEAIADFILSAITQTDDDEPKLLHEISGEWMSQLRQIHESGGGLTGISTGFPDLDRATRGLHGGELIIIGARPGMGKSVLAMNIANSAACSGYAVYILSLEMPCLELLPRMAASETRSDYGKIQSADLEAVGPFLQAFNKGLVTKRMVIDDNVNMTIPRLRARVKRFKRRVGGLDLVVVDYLQLLRPAGKGQSRYEQVSEISRDLKLLAMELGVPVICLSQLSRDIESRPDKRPMLSDLRDSGAIEQDANVVLLLYRESAYNENCAYPEIAELNIAKVRHGTPEVVPLIAELRYQRFVTPKANCLPANWRHQKTSIPQSRLARTEGHAGI